MYTNMKLDILPANMRAAKLIKNARRSRTLMVTIPVDIVERYDLKPGEQVMIAYLCKADEDVKLCD